MGAVTLRVADKTGDIEHIPHWFTAVVIGLGADKHVAAEQGLPGGLGGDAHGQVVLAVRADVQLRYEAVAGIQVRLHPVPELVKPGAVERAVYRAPVDTVLSAWLPDDKPVCRRASRARAGGHQQCPGVREDAFAALDGFFHQLRRRQVGKLQGDLGWCGHAVSCDWIPPTGAGM